MVCPLRSVLTSPVFWLTSRGRGSVTHTNVSRPTSTGMGILRMAELLVMPLRAVMDEGGSQQAGAVTSRCESAVLCRVWPGRVPPAQATFMCGLRPRAPVDRCGVPLAFHPLRDGLGSCQEGYTY